MLARFLSTEAAINVRKTAQFRRPIVQRKTARHCRFRAKFSSLLPAPIRAGRRSADRSALRWSGDTMQSEVGIHYECTADYYHFFLWFLLTFAPVLAILAHLPRHSITLRKVYHKISGLVFNAGASARSHHTHEIASLPFLLALTVNANRSFATVYTPGFHHIATSVLL